MSKIISKDKLEHHVLYSEYHSIIDICKPLKRLNIEGFIYMRKFPDGTYVDLSNQLLWSEFFLERYYKELYDNEMICDHMFVAEGISLWKLNPDNVIWQEGEKYFNFGNGISLCVNRKDYMEIFCFYSNNKNDFLNSFYLHNLDLLQQFCNYFTDKASKIITLGEHKRLYTPKKYLNDNQVIQYPPDSEFIKAIKLKGKTIGSVKITNREFECIEQYAMGNSAKHIARNLSLSPRTVETHLHNAKNRLNCKNLAQLVMFVMGNSPERLSLF